MKILYINDSLSGGGAEKLLSDFLPLIHEEVDCELLILTSENEKYMDSLKKNGVTVRVIPEKIRGNIGRIIYIGKYIKQGDFDIVHANLFPVLYYCSLLKRLQCRDRMFIYTEHSTDNKRRHIRLLRPIEKIIYKPYDYVVTISDAARRNLLEWLDIKEQSIFANKFRVIHNGIQVDKLYQAISYNRTDLLLDIKKDTVLLCMVGSFTEQKNHQFILKVMKILPDYYQLLLLGEGKLKEEMEQKVNSSKQLIGRVHFLGFRRDVASIIKTSDIVVIPSIWEGFGLIAVEAMACGKQVVCFDIPGLAEVVGTVGIKVKENDEKKFANAIIGAVENIHNRDLAEQCIRQAENYTLEKTTKKYLDLYRNMIKDKKEI